MYLEGVASVEWRQRRNEARDASLRASQPVPHQRTHIFDSVIEAERLRVEAARRTAQTTRRAPSGERRLDDGRTRPSSDAPPRAAHTLRTDKTAQHTLSQAKRSKTRRPRP